MCCSATLAIEMSSTSMKAASPTVGAISQRLPPPAASAISAHLHARHHRHAGAERTAGIQRIVEHDLDRNALHHLDVISRGILRRQQAEGRAAAALEPPHMPPQRLAGLALQPHPTPLPPPHL